MEDNLALNKASGSQGIESITLLLIAYLANI